MPPDFKRKPLLQFWAFLNVISQMTGTLKVGFYSIKINLMRVKGDYP